MLQRSSSPCAIAQPPGSDAGKASLDFVPGADDRVLTWTVQPARTPARVALSVATVAVTATAGLTILHSAPVALVCSLAVLGSVAEALFPVHYRVTPEGVRSRCAWQIRAMPWSAVRSAWSGPDGVYLCPFARPGRFTRTRGVVLRFAGGNDSAVLGRVRRYWKQEDAP